MNASARDRTRSDFSGVFPAASMADADFHSTRKTRSLNDVASFASAPGIFARWSIHGRRELTAIAVII